MVTPTDTVRKFYESFAKGDVPTALGQLDPNIEWTEAQRSPYFGGTWTGVDQVVAELFQKLGPDFEGFAATPAEFVAQGDRVVVLGTYTGKAKATGHSLEAPFVHSWTVGGDKLKRFVQYTDTALWREALAV